jgi:hypothetical protein
MPRRLNRHDLGTWIAGRWGPRRVRAHECWAWGEAATNSGTRASAGGVGEALGGAPGYAVKAVAGHQFPWHVPPGV